MVLWEAWGYAIGELYVVDVVVIPPMSASLTIRPMAVGLPRDALPVCIRWTAA
jgi:hypothetical protein